MQSKKVKQPGKRFGPPPEKGPNPQGLDDRGISPIQVKGKKFTKVY
jgi:hypothetical protein